MKKVILALLIVVGFASYAMAIGIQDVERITPKEVMSRMSAGEKIFILDVRSKGAYEAGDIRIKGDYRIAPDDLLDRMYELPMGMAIVTYCT